MLGGKKIAKALQHGGLAGSDFARQDNAALAALHTVDQIREGFFMLRAPEKKSRIRAHIKWVLGETKEGVVHDRGHPAELPHLTMRAGGRPVHRSDGKHQ